MEKKTFLSQMETAIHAAKLISNSGKEDDITVEMSDTLYSMGAWASFNRKTRVLTFANELLERSDADVAKVASTQLMHVYAATYVVNADGWLTGKPVNVSSLEELKNRYIKK